MLNNVRTNSTTIKYRKLDSDTSYSIIHVVLVEEHRYNDNESLQQRLHILTEAYCAAIKRGEVFSQVKKIYLAIKRTRAEISQQNKND